jgi:hypothetical protein
LGNLPNTSEASLLRPATAKGRAKRQAIMQRKGLIPKQVVSGGKNEKETRKEKAM